MKFTIIIITVAMVSACGWLQTPRKDSPNEDKKTEVEFKPPELPRILDPALIYIGFSKLNENLQSVPNDFLNLEVVEGLATDYDVASPSELRLKLPEPGQRLAFVADFGDGLYHGQFILEHS